MAPLGPAPDHEHFRLYYPATEEPLADVHIADEESLRAAVSIARETFEQGFWSTMLPSERARIMRRIEQTISRHSEELALLHTLETGIPIAQARAMYIPRSAENFGFFADLLASHAGETYEQTGRYLSIVTREPVGVALVIAPWNAPTVLSSMKLAAAIAMGNSVILKPSEYAPLSILRMIELAYEAGLPEGVVQVVCGTGETVGAYLTQHPGIDAVGFIGGTATGKRIMASAAGTLKKVGLELGGKSANIVLATADLERAIDGSLMAIFSGNGEQCLAGARILVEDSIADEFIEKFVTRTRALRVGDPLDVSTEIGPLAFRQHFEKVSGFAEEAVSNSHYRVLCGGSPCEQFDCGFFFEPTVVETNSNSGRLCQEEIFGPFVTIQRVTGIDDALETANDSDYGLVGYVWSDHLPSVMKIRKQLRTGTVLVNTPMARDLRAPFGGVRQSGIGRDGLPGSIELFTEEKSTLIPHAPLDLPKFGADGAP